MKTVSIEKKKNAKPLMKSPPAKTAAKTESAARTESPNKFANKTEGKAPQKANQDVISALRLVLSDSFVLYMKTYAVHWNYQGPKFFSVHKMTEEQYEQLAQAVDAIAERMRALDKVAPISLATILASSDLEEMSRVDAGNDQELMNLISSHTLLAQRAHEAAKICEDADDIYSQDMMIQRVGAHDKAAWMLRSFLDKGQATMPSEILS